MPTAAPLRIVFMGTPDFAVPSLNALVGAGYPPLAVCTPGDRRRGRGKKTYPTPVKAAALAHGLDVIEVEDVKDATFAERVAALEPDVIVVVAFKILPPAVYETARLGAFNLHASLLPAYRGAAPINRAIMAGAAETGVTTFFLQRKVDTGAIIAQTRTPIGPEETAGELHDRLMVLGADVVVGTVRRIEAGTADPQPQDDALASPAPKIFREDGEIDWTRSAQALHDHVRGLSPYPGAWTRHGSTELKVFASRIAEGEGTPGEVLTANDRLVVACGEGALEILQAQQPGKSRLDAPSFLMGYPVEAGDRFGDL